MHNLRNPRENYAGLRTRSRVLELDQVELNAAGEDDRLRQRPKSETRAGLAVLLLGDELGCVYVAAGFGSPLDPQDLGKDAIRQTRNDDARESGHFRPLLQGNSVNV